MAEPILRPIRRFAGPLPFGTTPEEKRAFRTTSKEPVFRPIARPAEVKPTGILDVIRRIPEVIKERKLLPKPLKAVSKFLFPTQEEREQRFVEEGLSPEEARGKATTERQFEMLPIAGVARGFTGLSKKILKQLVKNTSLEVAEQIIKREVPKASPVLINKIAQSTLQSKTTKEVENLITQTIRKVTPEIGVAKVLIKIKPPIKPSGPSPIFRERGFVTSVQKELPVLKIAGQYIPRSTDDLAVRAKNLIKSDVLTAENLARTGTDDKAVATASELIKHYGDLAVKSKGAERIAFYDKAAEIAVDIAPKLTEQGRAIQAASILTRQTPEGVLRFAARTIQKYNEGVDLARKIPELTGEQAKRFLKESKRIQEMPDGVKKAMAFKKLQDEIADLIPSPWYKKIINLWKAGLLTGIKTSGLNEFSNLFHGASEVVKDIPAALVDNVVSLFTKERKLVFTLRGGRGFGEGFEKGIRYMTTGFDERHIAAKLDWRRVSFGKSKLAKGIQLYEQTVFRWMGAMDQPFYYGAKARSLASQAIAEGKNKGLKGKEIKKFVNNLIQNPTDEMIRVASNEAEIAVFQNKTLLGDVARGIQKIPGGEVVVPFGRTPSAVAMQIINYSPIGIVKTIVKNIGKGKFDQRMFSQGIGRGLTGTGAIFIGMELLKKDLVSLDFPTTERERKQWELEGRKANAFKTPDGKWRSVLPLGPLGMLLILGGHLQKFVNESGSLVASLGPASLASLKSFKEQTFLVGINQFSRAIDDPGRYGENVIARTAASGIPTIVSDVARVADPLERRTYVKTEGFFAPTIARVPELRQTLEPRIDVLGSPVLRLGNALETMIDPTRPTRIKSNDLILELRRLLNAGLSATPTRFADEKKYSDVLTPEQITYLQEKAGLMLEEKLNSLIVNSEYKKLDDDGKMRMIRSFTNKTRVIARAEMVNELISELSNEERKTRLSELKESGFMTQQVFKKWQELFAPSF